MDKQEEINIIFDVLGMLMNSEIISEEEYEAIFQIVRREELR